MKTQIYIGSKAEIELPKHDRRKKEGFLFIGDEIPEYEDAVKFNVLKHRFNLIDGIDHKIARVLANVSYDLYPQGSDTLTVRGGRRGLAKAYLKHKRLDAITEHLRDKHEKFEADKKNNPPLSSKDLEVLDFLGDLLLSPVLKKMFCGEPNFAFNPRSPIFARVNRSELGGFDADAITLFLMAIYPGQLIVPRFGRYAKEAHIDLLEQGRLIGGVNDLGELPKRLRAAVMQTPDKIVSGALYSDAIELAEQKGLIKDTMEFNDEVSKYMH